MAVRGRSSNGSGIKLYGRRDFRTDGSFVTTQWFTFLWVPLFPLSSMRVKPSSTNSALPDHWMASLLLALGGLLVFKSSKTYVIQSKGRPVLRQVLYIYGFMLALGVAW